MKQRSRHTAAVKETSSWNDATKTTSSNTRNNTSEKTEKTAVQAKSWRRKLSNDSSSTQREDSDVLKDDEDGATQYEHRVLRYSTSGAARKNTRRNRVSATGGKEEHRVGSRSSTRER